MADGGNMPETVSKYLSGCKRRSRQNSYHQLPRSFPQAQNASFPSVMLFCCLALCVLSMGAFSSKRILHKIYKTHLPMQAACVAMSRAQAVRPGKVIHHRMRSSQRNRHLRSHRFKSNIWRMKLRTTRKCQ